jgi:hypothetical protein
MMSDSHKIILFSHDRRMIESRQQIQVAHFTFRDSWEFFKMKSFAASIAGCLVCLLAGTVALAQSDSARDGVGKSETPDQNSKPSDQGNSKPGATTKNRGKDTKPKPGKSTAKKSTDGIEKSDGDPGDGSGTPDGSKSANGSGAANGKPVEPNWSVDQISLAPYAGGKYSQNAVTIESTKGQVLIQATFQIEAMRSDAKSVERYLRGLNANDRKEMMRRTKSGARVLDSKKINLRSPDGKEYAALWSLEERVRTTIVHLEVSPNSQSSRQSTSGSVDPAGPWFDAEQMFTTRISRPFNQPPITEYATVFTGILRTDQACPVTFLFSVPESLDLQSLKLVVDSEAFMIGQSRAIENQ